MKNSHLLLLSILVGGWVVGFIIDWKFTLSILLIMMMIFTFFYLWISAIESNKTESDFTIIPPKYNIWIILTNKVFNPFIKWIDSLPQLIKTKK